jgi:hypothetical protein
MEQVDEMERRGTESGKKAVQLEHVSEHSEHEMKLPLCVSVAARPVGPQSLSDWHTPSLLVWLQRNKTARLVFFLGGGVVQEAVFTLVLEMFITVTSWL